MKENASTHLDEGIKGWRLLKKEKWAAEKELRDAGLEYAIASCVAHGLTEDDLYDIVDRVFNN